MPEDGPKDLTFKGEVRKLMPKVPERLHRVLVKEGERRYKRSSVALERMAEKMFDTPLDELVGTIDETIKETKDDSGNQS